MAALACLVVPAAAAEPQWELVTEEDGVRVTQREVVGRSMPIFRGRATLDVGALEILSVLGDIKRHTEWINACVDALKHLGITHIDMPVTAEKVWRILEEKGRARPRRRG